MALCIIKQRLISPATGQASLSFMPVMLTSAFTADPSSPSTGWLELPEFPGFSDLKHVGGEASGWLSLLISTGDFKLFENPKGSPKNCYFGLWPNLLEWCC